MDIVGVEYHRHNKNDCLKSTIRNDSSLFKYSTMKVQFWASTLIALLFAACGNEANVAKDAEAKLEKEFQQQMITLHDEVMPYMGDINALKGQLNELLPTIEDSTLLKSANHTIKMLSGADEGMMDWMQKNGPLFQSLDHLKADNDHEAVMKHLRKEVADMEDIKEMTEKGIANAKELIEKVKPAE